MSDIQIHRFQKRLSILNENFLIEIESLGSDIPPFYRDHKNLQEILDIYIKLGDYGFRKLQKYFDLKKEFLKINAPARREYLNILRQYEFMYPRIDSDSEDDVDE